MALRFKLGSPATQSCTKVLVTLLCTLSSLIEDRPCNPSFNAFPMSQDISVAPTFFPTEEEFADPLSYINKIRPEGER